MMQEFLSADFGRLGLNELMAHSAFARMVAAEFEDYGIDVPEEVVKRQKSIGNAMRRAVRALEDEIERLDTEEKELQKRE